MNKLEQLRQQSVVVADTGDIAAIALYKPQDATTNPSLVLKAAQLPVIQPLIQQARCWAKANASGRESVQALAAEKLSVDIGTQILSLIPGRVSTEVDARLSFDTDATIAKAHQLVSMYQASGVDPDRLLIKIAATWEGIRAAEALEKAGVRCNLTLVFSLAQAIACADAGVYLISPFVGRILDWYQANQPEANHSVAGDPGVQSVTQIFNYLKAYHYNTIVMAASFRSQQQIEQVAGCDYLTISPQLLQSLAQDQGSLPKKLDGQSALSDLYKHTLTAPAFRWALNENAMATEKLAEGIRQFAVDQRTLERDVV